MLDHLSEAGSRSAARAGQSRKSWALIGYRPKEMQPRLLEALISSRALTANGLSVTMGTFYSARTGRPAPCSHRCPAVADLNARERYVGARRRVQDLRFVPVRRPASPIISMSTEPHTAAGPCGPAPTTSASGASHHQLGRRQGPLSHPTTRFGLSVHRVAALMGFSSYEVIAGNAVLMSPET